MRIRQLGLVLVVGAAVIAGYWHAEVLAALSGASAPGAAPSASDRSGTGGKSPPNGGQAGSTGRGSAPPSVKTAIAALGSLHNRRQTIGWLASPASVNLTSPQQGIVTELVAKEGTNLRGGDLIARFDDRTAQSSVAKDRAQLERDQFLHAQAVENVTRAQTLFSKSAGTQQVVDLAQAAEKNAAAAIDLDDAALAADQVTLSNTEIRAPFDGRLGAFLVSIGTLVQPTGAIVAITQMSPLQVKFSVPEGDLLLVRKAIQNGEASIHVSPTAYSSDAVTGSIDFIDSVIDQASGTFKARATIPNADLTLWPGESATVVVDLAATPDLVMVPTQAVQPTSSGSVVYVVAANQTIDVRQVTVAGIDADQTGIAAGLKPGDHVIVEGQMALAQGAKVTEAIDTAAGSGSQPAGSGL
jgi:membrane fusion protein, multidrug efflux system